MSEQMTLSAKVTGDSSGFEKALSAARDAADAFSKKMETVSNKLESIGKAFAPISAAAAGIGAASTKMALDFEDSMANINTLLDDGSHLQGYEETVKRISNDTGLSLDTMADGMYQAISSLGDSGEETNAIFGIMAKSAKAGGAEVSDSVALISSGMKGYNDVSGDTAQKLSDLAFMTAKLGVTTFPEMAKSMQPLFPLANSLNISYEELFGSMATLTGVTGNTAEVSTQLKAVFSNLMAPTGAMQKMIEKYGYSSGQAMLESEGLAGVLKIVQDETGGQADKMAELFSSTEAITAMTALTGAQFDNFNTKLAAMGDVAGTTDTAYEKLITNGDKLRKAWNQVKNAGVELGSTIVDMITPAIEAIGDKVGKFTTWFSQASDSTKRLIVVIGGIVAAIAPALLIFAKITSVVSKVSAVMGTMLAPIGIAVAAVIGLAAVFVYFMKTNETFRNKVVSVWNTVSGTIANVAAVVKGKVSELTNAFLAELQPIIENTKEVFDNVANKVSSVVGMIKGKVVELKTAFLTELPAIVSTVQSTFGKVSEKMASVADSIKGKISELKGAFSSELPGIMTSVKETFSNVITTIINLFSPIVSAVAPALSTLKDAVVGAFEQIKGAVSGDGGLGGSNMLITIAGFMMGLNPIVKMLLKAFAQIGPQIQETFGQIIAAVAPVIGQIITLVANLISQVVPVLITAFQTIVPVVSQVITTIATTIASFLPVMVGIIQSVVQVIGTILPIIFELASALIPVISQIIQTILPVAGEIIGMIGSIIAQLAPFIAMLVGQLGPVIQMIASVISNLVKAVLPVIISLINVIMSVIQAILPVIMTIINVVMEVATSVISVIISVVSTIISALMPIISFIAGLITTIVSIIAPIISFIANVIATVISVIQPIISIVAGIISQLVSTFGSIFRGIVTIVTTVFSKVSSFISGAINVISGVVSTVSGVFSTVFNAVYSTVSKVMNKVKSVITTVFGAIKSAWNGLTGFVSGVFSGIAGAVETLVDTVKGFVNGVIRGINAAIGLINKIPGVEISKIPQLYRGTDNWGGGFAYMNEGGRGELTYLPNGTQVIPHDISVKYAKEAARNNTGTGYLDAHALGEFIVSAVVAQGKQNAEALERGVGKMRLIGNERELARFMDDLGFVRR